MTKVQILECKLEVLEDRFSKSSNTSVKEVLLKEINKTKQEISSLK